MNTSNLGDGSTKPYLLRAIYDWAIDHHLTPQVLVDVSTKGDEVVVPIDYVKEDRIVLTIHPQSVMGLEMDNQNLRFSARFSGKPFEVCIPIVAIIAIYCKENGQGIAFQAIPTNDQVADAPTSDAFSETKKNKKPSAAHLTLVK